MEDIKLGNETIELKGMWQGGGLETLSSDVIYSGSGLYVGGNTGLTESSYIELPEDAESKYKFYMMYCRLVKASTNSAVTTSECVIDLKTTYDVRHITIDRNNYLFSCLFHFVKNTDGIFQMSVKDYLSNYNTTSYHIGTNRVVGFY